MGNMHNSTCISNRFQPISSILTLVFVKEYYLVVSYGQSLMPPKSLTSVQPISVSVKLSSVSGQAGAEFYALPHILNSL